MINMHEMEPALLFRTRSTFDKPGLYALLFLLMLNPFHYAITQPYPYYREYFALFFLFLWFVRFFSNRGRGLDARFYIRKELFFAVSFPVLLMMFRIIDPGNSLYGDFDIHGVSIQLDQIDHGLYVVRNASLYIPMIMYFSLRGLSKTDIQKIAAVSVVVAPFSVLGFLYHAGIAQWGNLGAIVSLGGAKLEYNSYVPYLTFSVLSAMYLITCDTRKFIKIISCIVLLILCIYMLLSTSRQSVLFVIICAVTFLKMYKKGSFLKKTISVIILLSVGFFAFQQFTKDQVFDDNFSTKYMDAVGLVKTSRLQIAEDGLALLEPYEYLVGAGLTSVLVSGPHNDFIRWTQRVGVFAMILGFLPFFFSAKRAYHGLFRIKDNTLYIYLFLAILFTLYHSFFGYPREDAYQAMYCFLGLAMWLGFQRDQHAKGRV